MAMWHTVENTPLDSTGRNYTSEREQMVNAQIASRHVTDKAVLNAMRKVPRHLFVPSNLWAYAYDDGPLSIGYDQTISQPYMVAVMTEALRLDKRTVVLEVGTGSGYQTAVLAEICHSVFTIEVNAILGFRADKLLRKLAYTNTFVKVGDGYNGWFEHAPYDAIIVTCAPSNIPKPLKDQLAENGRMVIPYGDVGYQKLMLLTKRDGKFTYENILSVRFVPMVNRKGKRY